MDDAEFEQRRQGWLRAIRHTTPERVAQLVMEEIDCLVDHIAEMESQREHDRARIAELESALDGLEASVAMRFRQLEQQRSPFDLTPEVPASDGLLDAAYGFADMLRDDASSD